MGTKALDPNGLTAKQRRFVTGIILGKAAYDAAIEAGYTESFARSGAYQLVSKPKFSEAIAEGRERTAERTQITVDWVLREYESLYNECREENDRPTARGCLKDVGDHIGMFEKSRDININLGESFVKKVQEARLRIAEPVAQIEAVDAEYSEVADG